LWGAWQDTWLRPPQPPGGEQRGGGCCHVAVGGRIWAEWSSTGCYALCKGASLSVLPGEMLCPKRMPVGGNTHGWG